LFERAHNEIVEEHLHLSVFEHLHGNDDTDRSAYESRILPKVVPYGCYRGIISTRRIADACRRAVVFTALSPDGHHRARLRQPPTSR